MSDYGATDVRCVGARGSTIAESDMPGSNGVRDYESRTVCAPARPASNVHVCAYSECFWRDDKDVDESTAATKDGMGATKSDSGVQTKMPTAATTKRTPPTALNQQRLVINLVTSATQTATPKSCMPNTRAADASANISSTATRKTTSPESQGEPC